MALFHQPSRFIPLIVRKSLQSGRVLNSLLWDGAGPIFCMPAIQAGGDGAMLGKGRERGH